MSGFPLHFGEGEAERLQQFLQFDFWAASLSVTPSPAPSWTLSHSQSGNWNYSLTWHLCPATNKDFEQLFKRKNQKVHMQIKENAISMFPYGASSLSSLPGFRELCWASSVCSKHLLAFGSYSPPFRRCTGSDLECYYQDEERLRWVSGMRVLARDRFYPVSPAGCILLCAWFLWRFWVLAQFTAATTLC